MLWWRPMTTPSEAVVLAAPSAMQAQAALGAGRERRLHPLSWLFVLLGQLRQFALPLIALLFFGGRGGSQAWEWFGLVGVALLTGMAVVRYFTYRFRIEHGELVIRSGILHRNVRHIPLARIQNIALKRNLLHRLFGVAEVKLESAVGGISAEAQMRVLSLRDAHALEVLARSEHRGGAAEPGDEAEPELGELLLQLPVLELVKLGLTSNRGLLVGAAGFGVFSQFDGEGFGRLMASWVSSSVGYARGLHLGWDDWLLAGTLGVLALVAALRAFSVLLVLLQYHGFQLHELDRRLSVESGLLTRLRSHAPLRKVQHWTLHDGVLHRLFRRRSLRVETAVLQTAGNSHSLTQPVPIAPPAAIDALLARWLPWLDWNALDWQPLHARAWRRLVFWPTLLTLAVAAGATVRAGLPGLALLALLPFWLWRARQVAARAHWAVTDRALFWRSGWLDRKLSFAEIGKLQGLRLLQSPFDRRHGMASLVADTAGANPMGHRLELHYLPEAAARALYERLGAQLAHSTLRW
jgi:putative membrane protein